MKFRTIQTTILTACLCACITAFSGCSKGANEPYETPSGDSLTESSDDSSSESSEMSTDDTLDESSKPQTSSGEEYPEIVLNHEYLETVEADILYVWIHLYTDEEALRAEFEEKNPSFIDNDQLYYYYWPKHLDAYGDQIIREFLSDYGIAYEDVDVIGLLSDVHGDFDKSVVSLMLDDPRVEEIFYCPNPIVWKEM
ncbi:MAG: hypothetical protein K2N56_10435 [Oscillospiraceae bacterium]|nr:hypothetical protein [Oscillospiraceae bacterium]